MLGDSNHIHNQQFTLPNQLFILSLIRWQGGNQPSNWVWPDPCFSKGLARETTCLHDLSYNLFPHMWTEKRVQDWSHYWALHWWRDPLHHTTGEHPGLLCSRGGSERREQERAVMTGARQALHILLCDHCYLHWYSFFIEQVAKHAYILIQNSCIHIVMHLFFSRAVLQLLLNMLKLLTYAP